MPKSIVVAIVAVAVMVLGRIVCSLFLLASGDASLFRSLIPVLVALLILVGIITGHRLAWQWGRILGIISAILLTLLTLSVFTKATPANGSTIIAGFLSLSAVSLYVLFFMLGTTSAKTHFKLICPLCGAAKPKGGNFLYTKAICKKCNAEW